MYGWPTCWNEFKFWATSLLDVKGCVTKLFGCIERVTQYDRSGNVWLADMLE